MISTGPKISVSRRCCRRRVRDDSRFDDTPSARIPSQRCPGAEDACVRVPGEADVVQRLFDFCTADRGPMSVDSSSGRPFGPCQRRRETRRRTRLRLSWMTVVPGTTALAAVDKHRVDGDVRCLCVEVCVRRNDEWTLPAEFERDVASVRGGFPHALSHFRRAGESHLRNASWRQRRTCLGRIRWRP